MLLYKNNKIIFQTLFWLGLVSKIITAIAKLVDDIEYRKTLGREGKMWASSRALECAKTYEKVFGI